MADKDQIRIETEDDSTYESVHTLPSKGGDQRWEFEVVALNPNLSNQFNSTARNADYKRRPSRDRLPTDVGAFGDTAWGGPFRTQRRAEIAKDAMIDRLANGLNPYTGRSRYPYTKFW